MIPDKHHIVVNTYVYSNGKSLSSAWMNNPRKMQIINLLCFTSFDTEEMFEDTKGIIRSCISKDRKYNGKKKEQTNIY